MLQPVVGGLYHDQSCDHKFHTFSRRRRRPQSLLKPRLFAPWSEEREVASGVVFLLGFGVHRPALRDRSTLLNYTATVS